MTDRPNADTRTIPDKPLDEQRAILIAGLVSLIDSTFWGKNPTRISDAGDMVARLVRSGLATVRHYGGADVITMLDVTASASSTAYSLLASWQRQARMRLLDEVKK